MTIPFPSTPPAQGNQARPAAQTRLLPLAKLTCRAISPLGKLTCRTLQPLAKLTCRTLQPLAKLTCKLLPLAMVIGASIPAMASETAAPAASAQASAAAATPAVAPASMRVHYHRAKGDTANWGVYSWLGPKNPSKTWIADRFMFDGSDAFGAYVDIPLDTAKSEMRFLVSSERGAKNCGNDQSVKLSATVAASGQEIWLLESDCAIHDKAPAL